MNQYNSTIIKIKTLCDDFVDTIDFKLNQVGYGVGEKIFEIPNLLINVLGIKKREIIYEISANIDDMSSELYSYIYMRKYWMRERQIFY